MRCFLLFLCLSVLLPACKPVRVAMSGVSGGKQAAAIPATRQPVLLARAGAGDPYQPLRLAALHIRVRVMGRLAHTEMDLVFANDSGQVLEGELSFPLGEGQTLSGFSLDIDGSLRAAVAVEKARGRAVFESLVREQIDPGLAEWTRGNVFRTRVYPVPAQGHRRIQVRFVQELKGDPWGPQYRLPLHFQDRVDAFSVDVRVLRQEAEPTLEENELMHFIFRRQEDAWVANSMYKNYLPNEQLAFTLPQVEIAPDVFTEQAEDGRYYFYLDTQPDVPFRERKKVRRICLLWDHSLSAAQRDTAREFALLDAYFRHLGTVEIDLVPFAHAPGSPVRFQVRGGKWAALRQQLAALPFDGATQLGALNLESYVCDELILASDGLSNFGASMPALPRRPVHVLTSGPNVDFSLLRHIAAATGGRFLHAGAIPPDAAVRLLSQVPYRLLSATCTSGTVEEMYPPAPLDLEEGLTLAGRLRSATAEIRLEFGFDEHVISRQTLHIDHRKDRVNAGLVPHIWAQKKLAALDMHPQENRAAITAHGKAFGLVSRYTSLLVLDRVEDYVRHRITPPAELLDNYLRLLTAEAEQETAAQEASLEAVATAFAERKAWWERPFEVPDGTAIPDTAQTPERNTGFGLSEPGDADADGIADDYPVSEDFEVMTARDAAEATFSHEDMPEDENPTPLTGHIELSAWNPEAPYLDSLRAASAESRYARYLEIRPEYGHMPAFFLDVADLFRTQGEPALALRILSNIAEMELENHELLRVLAHRLMQWGYLQEAISVFRQVLAIREEEPQSWRDLALALAEAGEWQQAVDLLYSVAIRPWDERFPEIGVLVVHEMNSLIQRSGATLDLSRIDPRLLAALPTDLRVVLNWDADLVDMDLWVTDPRGEKCFYSHPHTAIGGRMSPDFTRGYGPEEFLLKKAMQGEYRIEVDYYGSSRQRIAGPVHIQAQLILHYGTPRQEARAITLRLGEVREVIEVGRFRFE